MIKKIAEFKDRLNQALTIRDIKPVELSATTSISESTISQYRSGYAKPKEEKLAKISTALDVNPAWLMGLDVPMDNEVQGFDSPSEFEKEWVYRGGAPHFYELDETESKIITAYRKADVQKKALILLSLGIDHVPKSHPKKYTLETPSAEDAYSHYYGYGRAAKKHSKKATKLIVRKKENV